MKRLVNFRVWTDLLTFVTVKRLVEHVRTASGERLLFASFAKPDNISTRFNLFRAFLGRKLPALATT